MAPEQVTGADVADARRRLAEIATELGNLSGKLANTSRELDPLQHAYQDYVDDYELGLLQRSEDDDNYRLPAQTLRLKLARRAYTSEHPADMGRMMGLEASRERMKQRIGDLKHESEAQRSILSALKTELEAAG